MKDKIQHLDAQMAAFRLFNDAGWDPDCWHAIKAAGVDIDHVTNVAGPIVRTLVSFSHDGCFEFDNMGAVAFAMAVHDEDAETVVDLVAWSALDPATFGTLFGAGVLGLDCLWNPASYVDGPCKVFASPLAWLKAGCRGTAILDHEAAREAFRRATGPITTENLDHAQRLLRSGIVPAHRLLVPATWRVAA